MTIATLELIHHLLKEDLYQQEATRDRRRAELNQRRGEIDDGAPGDDIIEKQACDEAYDVWRRTKQALEDFEAQEF